MLGVTNAYVSTYVIKGDAVVHCGSLWVNKTAVTSDCVKIVGILETFLKSNHGSTENLTGMGGAALAAAVSYPGKATRISREGQWSTFFFFFFI